MIEAVGILLGVATLMLMAWLVGSLVGDVMGRWIHGRLVVRELEKLLRERSERG